MDSHGRIGMILTLYPVRSRRHSHDSQADSAGSIPVTRSILEYPCSTIEWDAVCQVEAVPVGIRFALRAVTCNYRVPSRTRR